MHLSWKKRKKKHHFGSILAHFGLNTSTQDPLQNK